jgi:hypothetical protein
VSPKAKLDPEAEFRRNVEQVEYLFVTTDWHEKVVGMFDKIRRRSKFSREPMCAIILGEKGVGKTRTFEYYESLNPRERTAEGFRIPVLSLEMGQPATIKSLVTEILEALGDPFPDKGVVGSLSRSLRAKLKACGVEMIIIDEFSNFIDMDSKRVLKNVSTWLKKLINTTRIPVVLVGVPYADLVLDAPGNEQLKDRFKRRIVIEPFGWGETDEEQKPFRDFLKDVDEALPLEKSNLGSPTMAYRLYVASNGYLRHVMDLIHDAGVTALERGLKRIDLDLLAEAYEDRYAVEYPDRVNPFVVPKEELEIVPFAPSRPELDNLKELFARGATAAGILDR